MGKLWTYIDLHKQSVRFMSNLTKVQDNWPSKVIESIQLLLYNLHVKGSR